MSDTETFKGKKVWLDWNEPAIKLVADHLLELRKNRPDSFRRAVLVLPTAESARRLREYMATKVAKASSGAQPLLMPRMVQLGHLLDCTGEDVATEQETLAAWLKVLCKDGQDPVAAYAPLIPCRPEKNIARWAVGTAFKLMDLRRQLEQEGVSCNAVTKLLEKREGGSAAKRAALKQEQQRWSKLGELFSSVDALLSKKTGEQAREEWVQHPHWPGQSRLMIVACVPDLSPQMRRFLNNLHGTDGGEVQIWVNAPEKEAQWFDSFGMPTTDWGTREIDIPNALVYLKGSTQWLDSDASTLHLVNDATGLAQEAVRLAGGYQSNEVMVAVGDTAYTPAIIGAFEERGWNLYAPEGRSLLTTDVGRIIGQLADLCAAREEFRLSDTDEGGMAELNAFVGLLCNPALQRLLNAPHKVRIALRKHVESLRSLLLPSTTAALCHILNPATALPTEGNISMEKVAKARCDDYYNYAEKVREWTDACCRPETLPEKLQEMAAGMVKSYAESSLKRPVEKLARVLMQVADEKVVEEVGSASLLLEILRRKAEETAKGVQNTEARHLSVGDVSGWREVPFAPEKRVILGAMHDGCVPEPARGSEFLPDSLCKELNIHGSESYTARDSFLFTALLEGRKTAGNGDVHIIIARQNPDGTPAAPSSLLLRCGKDLPQRARILFDEPDADHTPAEVSSLPLFRADCGGKECITPGEMESIKLIAQGSPNPFAKKEGNGRYSKTFSPSSLSLFLQCPLSFWMKHLFGLNAADVYEEDKSEIASNEYGTLMHSALQKLVEAFPDEEALVEKAGTEDTDGLAEFLYGKAVEICRAEWARCYAPARFRGAMPLPLMVQAQNMEKTLRDFARQHVKDLNEGWCNLAREHKLAPTLRLSDGREVQFSMTADRIDRNKKDGRWRIIDYKTSDKDKKPFDAHLEKTEAPEKAPFYLYMNTAGYRFEPLGLQKRDTTAYYRWQNVQLMLYAFGLQQLDPATLPIPVPETSLNGVMPELFYYTLQGDTQSIACYNFMEDYHLQGASLEPILKNAMQTIDSSIRMILDGCCLFSAESLGLKNAPFSKLRDMRNSTTAPRFGGISPALDPRSMFGLPKLATPGTVPSTETPES